MMSCLISNSPDERQLQYRLPLHGYLCFQTRPQVVHHLHFQGQ